MRNPLTSTFLSLRTRHCAAVCATVMTSSVSANAQPMTAPGGPGAVRQVSLAGGIAEAPITSPGGRAIVEVMVNGKGPFRLGIETGMPGVVLFDAAARHFGVGGAPGSVTVLDSLTIGALTLSGVKALIGPPILPGLLDGFLGLSAYAELLMTIDYDAHTVRFERGELAAQGAGVLPLVPVGPLFALDLLVAGKSARTLFDTQGGVGLMLFADFAGTLPFQAAPVITGYAQSPAFGVAAKRQARLNDIVQLGPYRLDKPVITVQDFFDPIGNGILGMEVLSKFTVTLDQSHRRVRFSRSTSVVEPPPPVVAHGITVTFTPASLRVVAVVPGSPAAKLGMVAGDIIVSANGRATANWTPADWAAVELSASEATLVVERDGTQRSVVVPSVVFVP